MIAGLRARIAAARTPPPSTNREFWLEKESTPEPEPRTVAPTAARTFPTLTAPAPHAAVISARDALAAPTPLADELRRDRDRLDAANGRLVARIRALEAQLRGHGIEPVRTE